LAGGAITMRTFGHYAHNGRSVALARETGTHGQHAPDHTQGAYGALSSDSPVLEVEDLHVRLPTEDGVVHAVRGVSFTLRRGEVLGIVGESGCGKSVTSLAIMGLLPRSASVSGSVRLDGRELLGLGDHELSRVRGKRLAMVLQDPMTSLNPVRRIGSQLTEALTVHDPRLSRPAARRRAVELLETLGIPDAARRLDQHPHEFSGGMRQRVVIAMAMANRPAVIIADEPTTAIDVTIQAQVLEALKAAHRETGSALVLITHDLGVVAGMADRVLVMYAGRPVEVGAVDDIYYRPRMPYTIGLLGSLPRIDAGRREPLTPIRGRPPSLLALPAGCPFEPRCPLRQPICAVEEPPLAPVPGSAQVAACHFASEIVERDLGAGELFDAGAAGEPTPRGDVVLQVTELKKHFPVRSRGVLRRRTGATRAVDGVSFDLHQNETLGIVGESGSGKSTTGRVILQLLPASSGSIRFDGVELTTLPADRMRLLRRDIQIVFQDPFASLDPRMQVSAIIGEALHIHGTWQDGGAARVAELLELVGLDPEHGNRYPHEFSGGQRQRIGIARALSLNPRVLVLDEPVSALDVSIQAGIINLLEDLKARLGLSYVFVAHDLSVVRHISDRVAVMYLGVIVEIGETAQIFESPMHPYTQSLLSAIPLPDPIKERARTRILLTGDAAAGAAQPVGCRFHSRCPRFAHELDDAQRQRCLHETPLLDDRGLGHPSACHYARVVEVV
jgi:peptide/nickel transport system ATP-binding protein